jgi:hypothetical protein
MFPDAFQHKKKTVPLETPSTAQPVTGTLRVVNKCGNQSIIWPAIIEGVNATAAGGSHANLCLYAPM